MTPEESPAALMEDAPEVGILVPPFIVDALIEWHTNGTPIPEYAERWVRENCKA